MSRVCCGGRARGSPGSGDDGRRSGGRVGGHASGWRNFVSQVEADGPHRDVLPIPDRPFEGTLPFDAKDPDASFPAIEPLRPPEGAPNVLVVLLDDVGFAASSAFGGPCGAPAAGGAAGGGPEEKPLFTPGGGGPPRGGGVFGGEPPPG